MTIDATAVDPPFSAALRAATTDDHRAAEGANVLHELLAGRLDASQIGEVLGQHLLVYARLEAAADALAEDPVVAPFLFPGLRRTPVLTADVERLLGPGASGRIDARPATRAYLDRLDVAAGWSGNLIAHHYTRYLGDLSGGQHIGRIVARRYPDLEIGFYTFDEIADPDEAKVRYRALLDAAPWSEAERQQVIDEVRVAYDLNSRLLADLDPAPTA